MRLPCAKARAATGLDWRWANNRTYFAADDDPLRATRVIPFDHRSVTCPHYAAGSCHTLPEAAEVKNPMKNLPDTIVLRQVLEGWRFLPARPPKVLKRLVMSLPGFDEALPSDKLTPFAPLGRHITHLLQQDSQQANG